MRDGWKDSKARAEKEKKETEAKLMLCIVFLFVVVIAAVVALAEIKSPLKYYTVIPVGGALAAVFILEIVSSIRAMLRLKEQGSDGEQPPKDEGKQP